MIRKALLGIVLALGGCGETPLPPVEGEIIEQAVKHAQDRIDGGRRPLGADAALVESNG